MTRIVSCVRSAESRLRILKQIRRTLLLITTTVAAHPLLLLHQQRQRRVQAKEYTSQESQKINGLLSSCAFLLYADTNSTKENSEWVSCTSVPWGFWNRLDYRPVYDSRKTESVLCIDNKNGLTDCGAIC